MDPIVQGALVFAALSAAVAVVVVWQAKRFVYWHTAGLTDERNSWRQIAISAVESVEANVNRIRHAEGKPDFEVVPPVVAEHSSPISERQQATADVATIRARLTAARAALGLEPRT